MRKSFDPNPFNHTDLQNHTAEREPFSRSVWHPFVCLRHCCLLPSFRLRDYDEHLAFAVHHVLPRKEVIQPHLPIRLPCYDFTPVIGFALDGWLLTVTSPASGTPNSHGVTGGVYKARERIHRDMLIRDY